MLKDTILVALGLARGPERRPESAEKRRAAETCSGLYALKILKPLGTSKSLASGSPRVMSETSKFCVPDKGSCRLLMRLTPSLGENQNSRLDRRGLLFPMVPARMIVVSRVPTVSSPPMDCVPRSSDSDVEPWATCALAVGV